MQPGFWKCGCELMGLSPPGRREWPWIPGFWLEQS